MSNPSQSPETDKKRVIYEQQCQSFRQLNTFMWQVPVLAMTITGGIWFGISKVGNEDFIAFALYLLAAASNIGFIIVLWRVRVKVMNQLLEAMREYDGTRIGDSGKYLVIITFSLILLFATSISVIGALKTYCHHLLPT